jgi:tRNA pseudouridine55 synthase
LGTVTDTGDLDGNIISRGSILNINIEKIKETIEIFKGEFLQIPSMCSALRYNDKKLTSLQDKKKRKNRCFDAKKTL